MTDPATSKDPARRVAADVLIAVDGDDAYANLLLPKLIRDRNIGGTDAAFATEIAYGALRRTGVLDAVISAAAKRGVATLDVPVRAVLRLGAYQLLHTRVPPHAAVSANVDLMRELAGPKPTGLVNAVLRRVSQNTWAGWVDLLAPAGDAIGRLAFERGYPKWVATAYLDSLAGDIEQLDLALTDERPLTHLVARPRLITRDELLASAGPGATAGPFSPYAVRMSGGDPGAVAAVRQRRAAVQDEGSQLVAMALARADVGGRDSRWLDMCAGPGGKASLLAGLLPERGHLLAVERLPHRAALVKRALAGSSGADIVVADATRPVWRPGSFDRVLVDAPCTGLGALRRRAEARWRREATDAARLHPLQKALLDSALDAVRVGGVVAYATCSPHLTETVSVVRGVLDRRADAEVIDTPSLLPEVPGLGVEPFVQLWPHRYGTDAMFVAVVRRVG